ncbi:hypothetical protein L198_07403 [Cryptococcus wingfieldii CBS 7118]|uniref:Uncharacterized protein n=1 Tax=Cryptococcus wingfieldii CBS 7118 TaxID=1295528 RepID=A0A1E3IBY0_9TREE|nr:hypothetical protein L198_07403 [Cryptococcus wingfieldii CBS 7118]ODN86110.1 hypothetical protein L198_07403 [Cryptococcus wingfieldii CBS 7118]
MPNTPSPASSTSTDETTLPTPEHPYVISRSPSPSYDSVQGIMPSDKTDEDVFSPTAKPQITTLHYESPVERSADSTPGSIPSISVEDTVEPELGCGASPTPYAKHGSALKGRAPPPPIFLRRSVDGQDDASPEAVSAPGTAPRSSHPYAASKGLNISGVSMPQITGGPVVEQGDEGLDGQEEQDALPELVSPHRLNFDNPSNAPVSPAWQSFDSPSVYSPSFKRQSYPRFPSQSNLDVPSPLGPKSRQHEPTSHHGIHSRNLSLYFPQPGSVPPRENDGGAGLAPSPEMATTTLIPSADEDRKVFGGAGNWSFGQARPEGQAGLLTPDVKRSKRRGHHHKHSLSHNFFSFLDPTETNPTLSKTEPSAPPPDATPAPVPMPRFPSTTTDSLSPMSASKLDHWGRFLLSFAVLEFVIGAGLWVEGQMSGWRCLAGVGYLVVFDALGAAVGYVERKEGGGWSSVRRPYGPSRYVALLYFGQCLFLVFAAVYIAKESIEQVILGANAHDHSVGGHGHEGGGGHSHGHSHGGGEGEEERAFPVFLLICAAVASLFGGGVLGNHAKLVDAVGSLFLTPTYITLPFVSKLPSLFGNPFTLTVAGASVGILVSTAIVPSSSLHSVDALISLLLTIFTSALAYPTTSFFGHILLQTAPPSSTPQMSGLKKALREVKEDRRVLGLGIVRCWAVSVGKGGWDDYDQQGPGSKAGSSISSPVVSPRGSMEFNFTSSFSAFTPAASNSTASSYFATPTSKEEASAPLVVTLTVHVHPDSADGDVLDVTRLAWGKVNQAVGRGGGEGEVSVCVKRGWEGIEET